MTEERQIGLGGGLAGVCLVIVIAWALAAVLMLTGTLTNARQINRRVVLINHQVAPIDVNLASVKLARRTGALTTRILHAARPLTGQLAQVVTAADAINGNVTSILNRAHSINDVVTSINANAHSINSVVHAIGGNVTSIGSSVQSISASVGSIGADVSSIHQRVSTVAGAVGRAGDSGSSINGDVTHILGRLSATLSHARPIRTGIVAINNRAQTIIGLAAALKSDFDHILAGVGTTLGTGTVLGHANSIDCSLIINTAGALPTGGCNKTG